MIALVVLAALFGQQVLCAPPPQDVKPDLVACMQETDTTFEEINAWADGSDASENLKCQIKCMMMLTKEMTDDGRFVQATMMEVMPPETHAALNECMNMEQGVEMCEMAYRHHKCIRDKTPDFYGDWVRKMVVAAQ